MADLRAIMLRRRAPALSALRGRSSQVAVIAVPI
jgi:hypothetical protein